MPKTIVPKITVGRFAVGESADAPRTRVILQLVGKRWSLQPGEPWGDAVPVSRLVFIALHGQMDGVEILASLARCIHRPGP